MIEQTRQEIETRLRAACWALTTSWPRMLPSAPKTITWGTIGRTDSRPLVIPPHILDTRREALDRLTGWATVIVEERGLQPRIDTNDAPALAKLIDAHAQWVSLHDAGDLAAGELHDSARKCSAIAWPDKPEERFVGTCPTEGCRERVYAARGATNLRCRGCGAALVVPELVEALTAAVADHLGTVSEISGLLRSVHGAFVTPAMIRGYAARGKIGAHGTVVDHRGRTVPRYRIGDVVAAVEAVKDSADERREARRASEVA